MYVCIYIYIYETCWRKRRAMRTPKSSPDAGPYIHIIYIYIDISI